MEGLVPQVSPAHIVCLFACVLVCVSVRARVRVCTVAAVVSSPQLARQSGLKPRHDGAEFCFFLLLFSTQAKSCVSVSARVSVSVCVSGFFLNLTPCPGSQIQHLGAGGEHFGLASVRSLRAEVKMSGSRPATGSRPLSGDMSARYAVSSVHFAPDDAQNGSLSDSVRVLFTGSAKGSCTGPKSEGPNPRPFCSR